MPARRNTLLVVAMATLLGLQPGLAAPPPATAPADAFAGLDDTTEELIEVHLADRSELDRLVATGIDLAEYLRHNDDGTITVNASLTRREQAELAARGLRLGRVVENMDTWRARIAERQEAIRHEQAAQGLLPPVPASGPSAMDSHTDEVRGMRADYFVNYAGSYLSVEAKTSEGSNSAVTLSMQWDTGPGTPQGSGGSQNMSRFADAGQYMYHRTLVRVTTRPHQVRVTSSRGGSATFDVRNWVDGEQPPAPGYQQNFITRYLDPTETYDRILALEAEDERSGTDIVEIVDLPYPTNGYRRKASASFGTGQSGIVVATRAWGHEGGNGVTFELRNPVVPNQALRVETGADGRSVVVHLATGAAPGVVTSTAAQVAAAVNGSAAAAAVVEAATYRGSAGTGTVAIAPPTALTDGLDAPAHVTRDPFQVRAIRIGKHRDGSKVGVLAYHQEHAREWVTPLVAVETAERLFRNYATDALTRDLVDNLDVFIIPSVNPDGGHYSFYDFNTQRKNMTDRCGSSRNDPGSHNVWGVDINRNYQVGSMFDGYSGASSSCTSEVFAGPHEHSEPESRNVQWLADAFPNIKFAMNTHSYGGYFMWAPGAYRTPGRITLPAPGLGVESYFFTAAELVLDRIKSHRGTVILPGRTGPIADVLYSAAGNSADELWYRRGIIAYSFEVGADRFAPGTTTQSAVGFQPDFTTEGHAEAMEFAAGTIGLLEAALLYSRDHDAPEAQLQPGPLASQSPIALRFTTTEPATVYYTVDGSEPTLSSPTYRAPGIREPGGEFTLSETTTVRWFARDMAGNVSPVRSARYVVDALPPVTTATLDPAPSEGWSPAHVTVQLTAADEGGAGVATTSYRVDGGAWTAYDGPFGLAPGDHVVEFHSVDTVGNEEPAQRLVARVDGSLPEVRIDAPAEGATFVAGELVTADYSCSDSGSGLASCLGPVGRGEQIDTSAVGARSFTVWAEDVAGNRASRTVRYRVTWPFRGFFSPVSNPPAVNQATAGSTVPLKFSLGGDRGIEVVESVSSVDVPGCDWSAARGAPVGGTAPLGYVDGTYVLDWKTERGWQGGCREVTVALRDGTAHTARLSFR